MSADKPRRMRLDGVVAGVCVKERGWCLDGVAARKTSGCVEDKRLRGRQAAAWKTSRCLEDKPLRGGADVCAHALHNTSGHTRRKHPVMVEAEFRNPCAHCSSAAGQSAVRLANFDAAIFWPGGRAAAPADAVANG